MQHRREEWLVIVVGHVSVFVAAVVSVLQVRNPSLARTKDAAARLRRQTYARCTSEHILVNGRSRVTCLDVARHSPVLPTIRTTSAFTPVPLKHPSLCHVTKGRYTLPVRTGHSERAV